jgi:bifunctional N-acetylglucosamine-1-phosphate-uridyltransferase/glucosamine-1-phosphate-acetyltransferase GlmU-like protein
MVNNLITTCVAPTRPPKNTNEDLTIIILAANVSYGMKSYGPRSLLCINQQETILEYQIKLIKQTFPKADILLVVGFLSNKIIKRCPAGVRIIENQLFDITNETEQVRLALNCTITNNVLIIKDNIVFNSETLTNVTNNSSCIVYDSNNQIDTNSIGVTIVNNFATFFSYDIPTKWCHIVYLINKDLKIIKNLCNNKENSKLYMFEILNILLHKIEKIKAIEPTNMEIIKIDNSRDLEKLRG